MTSLTRVTNAAYFRDLLTQQFNKNRRLFEIAAAGRRDQLLWRGEIAILEKDL